MCCELTDCDRLANDSGDTQIVSKTALQTVIVEIGGTARESNLVLYERNRKRGDRLTVKLTLPAEDDIELSFRRENASGDLLLPPDLFPAQALITNTLLPMATFEFVMNEIAQWEYLQSSIPS